MAAVASAPDIVEIVGAKLQKDAGPSKYEDQVEWQKWVPRYNPAYHFDPELTNNIAADLNEGQIICLTGHAGCGKTSIAEQIAARTNKAVLRINMNSMAMTSDLLGKYIVKGGETIWVDGVLPRAMTFMGRGCYLLVDEADYASPGMMSPFNPVCEYPSGNLLLKEHEGETVSPLDGFRVIFTGNTIGAMEKYRALYPGTATLNEALKDRMRLYVMTYPKREVEARIIADTVPPMHTGLTLPMVDVANMVREAFLKDEIKSPFGTRKLIDWARMLKRTRDPLKAAEPVIFNKVREADRKVIYSIIERVTKPKKK